MHSRNYPPLRRILINAAAILGTLGPLHALHAEPTWPSKPIRTVVGFAAGGGTDLMARVVSQPLGELLGQPIIIDNKPGASGNIAAAEVIRAAADGYTILIAPTTFQSANPFLIKSSVNPAKDLTPVATVGRMQLHLVVKPGLPAKDLKELIALAHANPGKLSYGSSGPGTTPHLLTETFLQQAGITAIHVPYRGAAPSLQSVLAGETDFVLDPGISFQHVRANKLRMLAVASDRRSPSFPDVPTMAEAGVKGMDNDTWFGVWVPVGTPAEVTTRLSNALAKALAHPTVRQKFADMMAEAKFVGMPEFGTLLEKETRLFSTVIKERKLVVD